MGGRAGHRIHKTPAVCGTLTMRFVIIRMVFLAGACLLYSDVYYMPIPLDSRKRTHPIASTDATGDVSTASQFSSRGFHPTVTSSTRCPDSGTYRNTALRNARRRLRHLPTERQRTTKLAYIINLRGSSALLLLAYIVGAAAGRQRRLCARSSASGPVFLFSHAARLPRRAGPGP